MLRADKVQLNGKNAVKKSITVCSLAAVLVTKSRTMY